MSHVLQNFLADTAEKAATELETALLRLPDDKRAWSFEGQSRTPLDLVAECALLNGSTADIITDRVWPAGYDFKVYEQEKVELAQEWPRLQALLHENTAKVADAIRAVPDEDLENAVQMPWGPMTLAEVISYPYWNMSYHLGQINYVASMFGHLK